MPLGPPPLNPEKDMAKKFFNEPLSEVYPKPPLSDLGKKVQEQKASRASLALAGDLFSLEDKKKESTELMRMQAREQERLSTEQKLESIAKLPNVSTERKLDLISQTYKREGSPKSAQEDFVNLLSARALNESSPGGTDRQVGIDAYSAELNEYYRSLELELQGAGVDFEANEWLADDMTVAAVTPFSYGGPLVSVINKVAPHIVTGPLDLALPGSARSEFINWASTQPIERQVEIARDISEAINATTFLGASNDFIKADLAQQLLNWDENSTFELYLNNVFGVLDFLGAAGAARSGYKLVKNADAIKRLLGTKYREVADRFLKRARLRLDPKSTASVVSNVAPEKAKTLFEQAIADESGAIAGRLGADRETLIVESQFAKMIDDDVTPSPGTTQSGASEGYYRSIMSDDEVVAVESAIQRTVLAEDIRPAGVNVAPEKVHFGVDNTGIKARFHVTADDTGGFGSLRKAKLVARQYADLARRAGLNGFSPTVLARDFSTGKYAPIDEIENYISTRTVRDKKSDGVRVVTKNNRGVELARVEGEVTDTTATITKLSGTPKGAEGGLVKDAYDRFIRKHLQADLSVQTSKKISNDEFEMLKELEAEGYVIEYSKGLTRTKDGVESTTGAPVATILETSGKPGQFEKAGYQRSLGDFMVRLDIDEAFHAGHALAENPVLGTGVTGRLAKWLDKGSWATKWFVVGTNQAGDQFSARVRLLRETLQPLNKLSPENQRKVYAVLDEGDRTERWFKYKDLKDFWGADKDFHDLARAYKAAQKHQELVYEWVNDATYRRLLGDGFREFVVKGIREIAKPLKSGDFLRVSGNVKKIYDSELDKVRDLTAADIENIRAGGAQAVKFLRGKRDISGSPNKFIEVNYAIHNRVKSKAKINDLPKNVLNQQDGYITRMYDAAYLIRQPYQVAVDGGQIVTKFRVVGIERDLSSARLLQEQLIEDAVELAAAEKTKLGKVVNREALRNKLGKQHQLVRSNELSTTDEYYDPLNLDYIQDTGQLYTSPRRASEITGLYEDIKDPITGSVERRARRTVLSVAETLEASQVKAARAGTLDIAIDKLIKNWKALYEEKFGDFPFFHQVPEANAALKNADPDSIREYKDAVAFADYIKMIGGFDESAISRQARKFLIETSENILLNNRGSHWASMLANGLVRARNLNVIDHLKSMAFFQLITMRPVRQAVLQMNQMSLYMAHGDYGKYFMGEGAREFAGIWMGLASRSIGNFDSLKHRYARGLGMTTKEYEDTIQAYVRSGLPASVDSHVWVLGSRTDRVANSLAKGTTKAEDLLYQADKGLSIVERQIRRYGFDLGEQTQLLAAFLAEKRAWQLANPKKAALWKDEVNLAEIAGMARNLSGNMNRTGVLGFQSGVLGMAFQFMSHTSKMLQVIAPTRIRIPFTNKSFKALGLSKIANKHIENSSKRNMFITQALMYGTGGVGLTEAYEWILNENGWDFGPEVNSIVEEGLFGTMLNMGLRIADGRDIFDTSVDIEASKSLSPLGGSLFAAATNPITKIYDYFIDSPTPWYEMLGPGVNVLTRRLSGIPVLGHIMMDASYLDADERLEAALVGMANVLVLETDSWNRARYEWAVGRYLSRNGNQLTNASHQEILTRVLLGPKTRAANRLGDLERQIEGVYGGYRIEPEMSFTDLKNKAKSDFANIEKTLILAGKGEVTGDDFAAYVKDLAEKSHIFMSEREREIYKTYIYKEVRNAVTEDTQENRVIKHLLRIYPTMPDDPMQDMFTRIQNLPEFENKGPLVDALKGVYY